MYYSKIRHYDTANGPGVRVSLFVSGCTNKCPGCFNPETWDFKYGKVFDRAAMNELLDAINKPYIHGISILGGEPLHPMNTEVVARIIYIIRQAKPDINIWVYTGYTLEEIEARINARGSYDDSLAFNSYEYGYILNNIDVLVDGRFVQEKKNLRLRFRGSENQRIIDIPYYIKTHEIKEPDMPT